MKKLNQYFFGYDEIDRKSAFIFYGFFVFGFSVAVLSLLLTIYIHTI